MTNTHNIKTTLNNILNTLITQRQDWEAGAYKQANTELYAILEKCGAIYAELKADKKSTRAFNAIAEEQGIKFNKGTSLALKIVRVVFNAQSNREFAYARVLKVWHDESSEQQTLTNFVIERGGVENVRRAASAHNNNKLTADDYRDIAANALTGEHALATFDLQNYMLSDSENDTDYMVALVYCGNNGSGKIVHASNKRGLVNNALTVMGKEIDELQKQAESKATLQDVKQQKTVNMKKFVARITDYEMAA